MVRLVVPALLLTVAGCTSALGADFNHPPATEMDPTEAGAPGTSGNQPGGGGPTTGDAGGSGPCAFADCKVPQASNASVFGALPDKGDALSLVSSATFDTTAECKSGSILGDCTPILQSEGPAVCVCRFGSLAIHDLKVTGARGLALLAHDTVTISGTLDVAATNETGGPGAEPAPTVVGGSGMFLYGTVDLIPLRGGAAATEGSAGGGALQISAGTSVVIEPTATIQAGGGGGLGQAYAGRPAGSGGAILLEAPVVKLEGQLLANGGGGGGGGNRSLKGGDGQDARAAGRAPATGGAGEDGHGCQLYGYTSGGHGGSGAIEGVARVSGQPGDYKGCINPAYLEAGGDGGGVGRIRINASSGANIQEAATSFTSPKPSTGILPIK